MSPIGLPKFGFDLEIFWGGAVSSFLSTWIEGKVKSPDLSSWLPLTWVDEEFFLLHDLAVFAPHTTPVTLQPEVNFLLQCHLAGRLLHECFLLTSNDCRIF